MDDNRGNLCACGNIERNFDVRLKPGLRSKTIESPDSEFNSVLTIESAAYSFPAVSNNF
jgi:hypothetical protein